MGGFGGGEGKGTNMSQQNDEQKRRDKRKTIWFHGGKRLNG